MTTPTPTDDSPEALEALFNELSQARADGTELPVSTPSASPDPLPAEPAAAAPAPVPAPAAAEPSTPVTAAPTPAPTPAAALEPAPDLSKLDEATRRYFQKLDNDRKAAVGRAAALQRDADAAKRRQAAAPAPAPAPAASETPTAKLEAEFPELAAALKHEVATSKATTDEEMRKLRFATKSEVLEGMFPGWFETMKSDEFNFWLTQQDADTQKKFESDSTRDYAALLRSYEIANAPAPAADDPAPASEVARIKADREARLARSTALVGRKEAPNPTGEPDPESDPEGYFNWLSAKGDRERERDAKGRFR